MSELKSRMRGEILNVMERKVALPESLVGAAAKVLAGHIKGHRRRERALQARIAAALFASQVPDDEDITDYQRGYRACAEVVRQALRGEER